MTTDTSAAPIAFRHIMIATDLSPASVRSLPYIVAIAQRFGSTVFVAHVIPLEIYGVARPQSLEAVTKEAHAGAQEKLAELVGQLREQGVAARTLLGEGDVGIILNDWIHEHHFDMIAMGTTGRSGVRKLVLGSMAEEMIRDAECPVLTVGPEISSEAPAGLKTILYATDFSRESAHAALYARALTERSALQLIVLHVRLVGEDQGSERALRQRLSEFVESQVDHSALSEVVVAEGKPADKILEIANQHAADIIVIGVRGAGPMPRLASHFGSTAHDIVLRARCPVLTVRVPRTEDTA
jgi:nucleotide-binding universal stress UspA family protein